MNIMDIAEMICDWKAAARRSPKENNFADKLDYAFDRYSITGQLKKVMTNTLRDLGWL
jgi:hypothetical protein